MRFQISSYRANSSPRSSPATWAGVRKRSPAGRIASWASWAFLTFFSYSRGDCGHVLGAVEVAGLLAGGGQGGLGQRRAVRTHVGDVAVLVQALRHAHGVLGGQPQLARGLLLEGRGGEGCRRPAGVGLLLDRGDGHLGGLERLRRWSGRSPRRGAPRPWSSAAPSSAKSRPVATRAPSTRVRRAVNWLFSAPGGEVALDVPVGARTNAIRSRSRSTTRRVATDWTRPADRPALTLRQSTGETS